MTAAAGEGVRRPVDSSEQDDAVGHGPPGEAPGLGTSALLGAAAAVTVPLVAALLRPGPDDLSTSLSAAFAQQLRTLAGVLVVFLLVQAAVFRVATGVWRPRVYFFPCLAFMLMVALSYPRVWLHLTSSVVADYVFALVVGALAAVLMERLVDPATEKKTMPVLIAVVVIAGITMVAPSVGGFS